jgi:Cu/Ag efflux protein CusF
MRILVMFLAAALTFATSPAVTSAQVETPATTAGAPADTTKGRVHRAAGEVLTVDPGAKVLTVKTRGWRGRELTFAVEEAAAATLADLHPGDRVRVRYAESDGKLDATAITRLTPRTKS